MVRGPRPLRPSSVSLPRVQPSPRAVPALDSPLPARRRGPRHLARALTQERRGPGAVLGWSIAQPKWFAADQKPGCYFSATGAAEAPSHMAAKNTPAEGRRRGFNPVMMVLRFISGILFGIVRLVFRFLVGSMALLHGWRNSAVSLVDNGYADSDTLWRRIQALKVELMQKEQRLSAFQRMNEFLRAERIPALEADVKDREEALSSFDRVGAKGKPEAALEMHNKLKANEKMIKSLKAAGGDASKEIQRLERAVERKTKDVATARESHQATSGQMQDLLAQIAQKDEMIMSLSLKSSGSRQVDELKSRVWEQAKVIEGLRNGIGQPSNDDKLKILQKELKDQDATIASLKRQLRLAGKPRWTSGGKILDVMFFPDKAKDVLPRFLEYFTTAKKSLDICVFTITSNEIADEVLRAHERGLRVRVISDDDQMATRGSDIQRLRDAGIPVRHDNSPYYMHHKFCIFDGKILANGSFNWSRQATQSNYENIIVYDDKELVKEFQQQFQLLWSKFVDSP
eukprot:evm.model.scf_2095.4 EVM.evm.TU.scf_2095.4   scf_2095:18739-25500(-)